MPHLETLDRSLIEAHQLARLQLGLSRMLPTNRFYQEKFAGKESPFLERLADLALLPFTDKRELVADQAAHPLFGSNLTFPLRDYIRLHQTSGTTGNPLKILDTQESWDWWGDCWTTVFQGAGVTRDDTVRVSGHLRYADVKPDGESLLCVARNIFSPVLDPQSGNGLKP